MHQQGAAARLLHSTRVPMADRFVPMMRSLSQCPGTALSAASTGRSEIITSAVTCPCGLLRDRSRGTRSARPRSQGRAALSPTSATSLDVQGLVVHPVTDAHVSSSGRSTFSRWAICSGLPPSTISGPADEAFPGSSTRAPQAPRSLSRRAGARFRRAVPAHIRAVQGAQPAWLPSVAVPSAPPSTARPTPGIAASLRGWPRSGAAPARSLRISAEHARDLTHPDLLCVQDRDVLTLGEGQIPASGFDALDRGRAATLPGPSRSDCR